MAENELLYVICIACGRSLLAHSLEQARACLKRLGLDEKRVRDGV